MTSNYDRIRAEDTKSPDPDVKKGYNAPPPPSSQPQPEPAPAQPSSDEGE